MFRRSLLILNYTLVFIVFLSCSRSQCKCMIHVQKDNYKLLLLYQTVIAQKYSLTAANVSDM